ncbi:MAG: bifunctional UDP-4-keto-pentose/UDP-xylose synthase [Nitrospirae bacterium]|nr:MAG: bifunctional UDP-4-keto-pentose/UDP-xylose synthase [Nitrospirota bacterium]
MRVFVIGANGFIGHHLIGRILSETNWDVSGIDVHSHRLVHHLQDDRFHFLEGDMRAHEAWIEERIKESDVVLPLVSIATPALYIREPLKVFELNFEENLKIIRTCVRHRKYLVFPSTSEVYGLCPDDELREDAGRHVFGNVESQRWIYGVSKHLLERVIWAYGIHEGLKFTIVRPFNWIGPGLDGADAARSGAARVVTQFIWNLLNGEPLRLVNGGEQRRCFTYISDGIDCLMAILGCKDARCHGQIFNIGNPSADLSIRELAGMIVGICGESPLRPKQLPVPGLIDVPHEVYYGPSYQDIPERKPSISKARDILGWTPKVGIEEALKTTVDFYLAEFIGSQKPPHSLNQD